MGAEERVAEGCWEKGSGLNKHAEVGMYGAYVERYLFLFGMQGMAEA